jgi:hypothetical protein
VEVKAERGECRCGFEVTGGRVGAVHYFGFYFSKKGRLPVSRGASGVGILLLVEREVVLRRGNFDLGEAI